MKSLSIGLKEALRITLEQVRPLEAETIELGKCTDRIVASDLFAKVDSPSIDSSLKDGFAVVSGEVAGATPEMPVRLEFAGQLSAGEETVIDLKPGTTVRVLTGARLPYGADAVLSEEFTKPEGCYILCMNFSQPGRNILPRGSDVKSCSAIIAQGQKVSPGMIGLIAAAGHSRIPVFRNPSVAIIGTGDELVVPGEHLADGNLYASNIMTIEAWCRRYGMNTFTSVIHDDFDTLTQVLKTQCASTDAVITSGGAWTGDRDLVAQVLEGLGWHQYFHRIRIGPGKAVGFGVLEGKPVFILPGGPSSNLMGFLQIALPGLLALGGHAQSSLPRIHARLGADLIGRNLDWTDFFFGTIEEGDGFPVFRPLHSCSRLRDIAEATAIAAIPEGKETLPKGSVIYVQVL